MNKIDEIALRVADEVFTGNCEDNSEILAFARALLAELSKDAEPVAEVVWFDPELRHFPETAGKIIDGSLSFMDSAPIGTKLFTHPTNTAEIEQRVAEAIAKLCEVDTDPSMYWSSEIIPGACFAKAIRSGKWREYQ